MPSRGFTLLELLVVVSLLAALAGFAWNNYHHLSDDVNKQLAQVQLDEVAKALRRFRADTGYWPGETPIFAVGHAADLGLLVQAPAHCDASPLCRWQAQARCGWHGPYLERDSVAWVRVYQLIDGHITSQVVQGVSAGKQFKKEDTEQYAWYVSKDALETGLQQRGRPILFFPAKEIASQPVPARLVSAGGDGDFGTDPEFDSRNCAADPGNLSSKDNLVVCLE